MEAAMVGFAGDAINFIAAILLAWDPIFRQRVYLSLKVDKALPDEITFLDYRGRPVQRGEKLEAVQVRGESLRSRIAYLMLIVGFALVTGARWIEAHPPGHTPRDGHSTVAFPTHADG